MSQDIGSTGVVGSASEASGTWTLDGSGADVYGTTDEFRYAYQRVTGDLDIRVRVTSLENVNRWSKAGLMIRESLAGDARNAFMLVSPSRGRAFQARTAVGGATTRTSGGTGTAPVWLRLVRQGSLFTGYLSADGTSWTTTGSATINMTADAYVGLAVSSRLDSTLATATFTDVQILAGPVASALPAPWTTSDIGSPARAGSASATSGTFTVVGGGIDIWDTSDQFQFVRQPLQGDVEVIARVASLEYADGWSKAGVMIRETLTGGSRHAFMLASGTNGWEFQRRTTTGSVSDRLPAATGVAPGWVRLVREGNLFSAYRSTDGTSWTLVGTDTITMASTVYVGLAVTSHNASATAAATFTNVTARAVTTGTNQPPTVSLTSPAAGASFTAPATVTLAASASDTDGTITKVDFFQGSQLISSDTTNPYSATWTGAAAGAYQLTAVATDSDGVTATSPPVSVTVKAATNQPPTVSLTAPAAGATFAAPASVTISASATDTDGTVTQVDFYQGATLIGSDTTSPYSAAWTGATAGSYSLTARAVDNGGATGTSPPVAITVTAASNQLPTVSITSPTAGQSFSAPASLTIAAAASDTDGTIVGVDFYVGTQLLGTDSTSPYTAAWPNVAAGSYSLTAVARDNAAGTRTSAVVAVTVTSSAPGLPAPWANGDLGGPALAGTTSLSGATFTVTGGGIDIFDMNDQFQFAYQSWQGDVEIVARVASLQQADPWSKAGVMIRETLTGGSRHGFMLASAANGWPFQRRLQTNGGSIHVPGLTGAVPGWVRLVRLGNLVTAYQSPDGVTWTVVGTDTISMASAVYVGLAVTSHNPSATATATFTNVTVSAPNGGPNQPPTVSLTSPAAGASFAAPADVTLNATASDTDGTVARVDFYQGSTLIGSDTTSPYSAVWSGATAGSSSLTARAVDDDGATGTSTAVAVTVTAASNQLPTVSITSPIAGQSFTAPASLTITAAASDPDGTIARVDFYAGTQLISGVSASPYTALWSNVAAGNYALTAVARDNSGGTRTSGSVAVTISATAPGPTTLVFGASADHATNVTSYIVALYRAVDPVTASPVATRDIGKPTPVNGDISVDISTLVNPLPAGSYYAVVRASGLGGTTASAPSAAFAK